VNNAVFLVIPSIDTHDGYFSQAERSIQIEAIFCQV
jgi:hypothetical protein